MSDDNNRTLLLIAQRCGFRSQNWLPVQPPLRDRKNNFRSFIYFQNSANRANFVKIGSADVEITGLTEISKNMKY